MPALSCLLELSISSSIIHLPLFLFPWYSDSLTLSLSLLVVVRRRQRGREGGAGLGLAWVGAWVSNPRGHLSSHWNGPPSPFLGRCALALELRFLVPCWLVPSFYIFQLYIYVLKILNILF